MPQKSEPSPSAQTAGAVKPQGSRLRGDHSDVVADGPTYSASLTLITRGDRQSVVIKSNEANASVKGVTISLQRGGAVT
jgi:hypothetical protein